MLAGGKPFPHLSLRQRRGGAEERCWEHKPVSGASSLKTTSRKLLRAGGKWRTRPAVPLGKGYGEWSLPHALPRGAETQLPAPWISFASRPWCPPPGLHRKTCIFFPGTSSKPRRLLPGLCQLATAELLSFCLSFFFQLD